MGVTSDARVVWQFLNGIAAIYKPAGYSLHRTRNTILTHLCRDLNALEGRPQREYVRIEGETDKPMTVQVVPNLADHLLLTGPHYQQKDFKLSWVNYLGYDTSGVVIIGINEGARTVMRMRESNPTRFYKVKGVFGQATDNYFTSGKIVEKATYKSIKRATVDAICASMQASHQRKMFELCGVDMQSQAAYELAIQGPIRPANNKIPMIYAIKCVAFNMPEFTLEIACINEYEMYLKTLVHQLGIQLHSVATCTQIQCFRYGLFTTELALLKKHWDVQSILDNMEQTQAILDNNKYLVEQDSPTLIEQQI
ncbi:mitochondrial mRNA pseudouridine synthase Trub2 [Neodiprion virginianus]|uniref:Mitochondrial mRNA pseudouridine synthase Trub2 n=1 Tax=Neodiprion lecontei TaxID=441921 RepID=A0A6J0BVX2_NEOLC|nr:mitochondrial mRNA pseudouridine synthase Trub2 [Neodiprion lecontei]XP_046613747.1 mitochondrial mRNA pseudouridine synthase Trub2 [Neodiprion virginianus]